MFVIISGDGSDVARVCAALGGQKIGPKSCIF